MRLGVAAALVVCSGCLTPPNQAVDGGDDGGCNGCASRKPTLMFLIDKSGSMSGPSNSANPACPAGCGASVGPCPAGCPTRISELRAAMNTFLTGNGNVAWTGMAIFPTKNGDACGPTAQGDVLVQLDAKASDLDADLNAAAIWVNTQIQSLAPGGGTPTAESLRFMLNYQPLLSRDRYQFVLLLTDGLPNCNGNNPNTCMNGSPVGAACKCNIAICTATSYPSYCTLGCLDKDNSVAAITELRKKYIRTIVVGFGADTASGDGPDTLNAMAEAGGFARSCPKGTDAECGANNTCNTGTKVCVKQFYQATSALELSASLADIAAHLQP